MKKSLNHWHVLIGLLILVLFSGCAPTQEQSVTIEMILIPAGEFTMGGDGDQALAFCEEYREPFNFAACKK